MDPLDDIFAAMRVASALHARIEASAPWGLDFAAGRTSRFGLVVQGTCWMEVEGRAAARLASGDCFVLVRGTRYVLRDNPRSPTRPCSETVRDHVGGTVVLGGGGRAATVITGWFTFDEEAARPLIELLPEVLHARVDEDRSQMLEAALKLLNLETEAPGLGSGLVVSRLADIVFVQAIRGHAASGPGWLSALADRRIGPALRAVHGDLARAWTVTAMARLSGMSRSAFVPFFRQRVGQAPLAYLTRWRMFRAGCLLRGGAGLGEVAACVGYASEAAFNKAFKRVVGITPGLYRRNTVATPAFPAAAPAVGRPSSVEHRPTP